MCGIVAMFAYGRNAHPVAEEALRRVRDHMATRGPDGAGLWISDDGRVGLAHRRLSIIDLSSAGSQPMASPEGRLRIVYNGEIYNYRALRAELVQQGRTFTSTSDTEVLLHLYDRDGPDMVRHLRGMYAFAIWDDELQGLFLARDPFGIKPLYFADNGATLQVASQVKALNAGGGIDNRLDPAGQVGFFLWGYVPEPFTIFQGVRALEAGTTLWIDRSGRRRVCRHFDLTAEMRVAEDEARSTISEKRAIDEIREALIDSVRHHLVADVPVGAFLSSGIDSATLAALTSEVSESPLNTVTLGFDEYRGTPADETILAAEIATRYGAQHAVHWVRGTEFASERGRLLSAMDQPSIDGVNTYFVSKVTAAAGLKVALSGVGGDELFGGYASFREVPRIVKLLRPLRRTPFFGRSFRWLSAPLLKHLTSPKYAGLFEYGTNYSDAYLLRRGLFMPWELPELLDPDLVREGWRELKIRSRLRHTIESLASSRVRVSALELAWYMRNQLLRDADWAGMAHSLEIRVPLVDIALFRRVLPLMMQPGPPNKRDIAIVPTKKLPITVIERRKTGFSIPVDTWFQGSTKKSSGPGSSGPGLRGWSRTIMSQWEAAQHQVF